MIPCLQKLTDGASRLDVVNDTYKDNSLKSHAIYMRGTGGRLHKVQGNTKLPRDLNTFLRNDHNKTELILYLCDVVLSEMKEDGKTIVFTTGAEVRSVPVRGNNKLHPCNHEEAVTKIFLDVADAAESNIETFLIRTNDTDVLVLAVVYASQRDLNICIMW